MTVIGDRTTRDERRGWDPFEAIRLARDPASADIATVATAMFDQLAAAHVPIDAVDLCIVFWSRALEDLEPGPVPTDRLARLDRDVAHYEKLPTLANWIRALRGHTTTAHDLDWSIQFLLRVRQTWLLSDALRLR